jgi:hypothetical protein
MEQVRAPWCGGDGDGDGDVVVVMGIMMMW